MTLEHRTCSVKICRLRTPEESGGHRARHVERWVVEIRKLLILRHAKAQKDAPVGDRLPPLRTVDAATQPPLVNICTRLWGCRMRSLPRMRGGRYKQRNWPPLRAISVNRLRSSQQFTAQTLPSWWKSCVTCPMPLRAS